jgi:hypothetical protein
MGFDFLTDAAAFTILKTEPLEPRRLYSRVFDKGDAWYIEQGLAMNQRDDFECV